MGNGRFYNGSHLMQMMEEIYGMDLSWKNKKKIW